MSDWTSGYVADIGYTFGYYAELNPLRLRMAFLGAGLQPPECGVACELGFGQGVSANMHAAASVTRWYGTDFNPSQAAHAQELAAVSGSGAQLFDEGFDVFCQRDDLPEFDYIGLHGIWSWISDANRAVIVDFIRRKLKVGGVLYISYNTQPGWAAMVPMRDLLTEHSEVMGAPGHGTVSRIDAALEFADKLMATNPMYLRANPGVAERLKQIKGQNRNYVAHEYFNRDWLPMPFARMADWLAPTKLSFACSAAYFDHADPINLTDDQQTLLKEIPDPMFRETARDFCVNQQFRRDYWVKGPRKLSPLAQREALQAQKVLLVMARADVPKKVKGGLGEAELSPEVYEPILDFLGDHQPHTLGEIALGVQDKQISFAQVLQAIVILTGAMAVLAVQDDAVIAKAAPRAMALNLHLIQQARGNADVAYLASPVIGGAVAVQRFSQLFLLGMAKGYREVPALAEFTWNIIAGQGQRLVKAGKPLETPEESLEELRRQVAEFQEKELPILMALRIAS